VTYRGVAEPLGQVWVALRANIRGVLDAVTVADVLAGRMPPAVIEALHSDSAERS
jgi:hypothetical protein